MSHFTNRRSGSRAESPGPQRLLNLVAQRVTENASETFLSPTQLAQRWLSHPETIRRQLRKRQITSILIGRKRLIAVTEVLRIEAEGRIPARDVRSERSVRTPIHESQATV